MQKRRTEETKSTSHRIHQSAQWLRQSSSLVSNKGQTPGRLPPCPYVHNCTVSIPRIASWRQANNLAPHTSRCTLAFDRSRWNNQLGATSGAPHKSNQSRQQANDLAPHTSERQMAFINSRAHQSARVQTCRSAAQRKSRALRATFIKVHSGFDKADVE